MSSVRVALKGGTSQMKGADRLRQYCRAVRCGTGGRQYVAISERVEWEAGEGASSHMISLEVMQQGGLSPERFTPNTSPPTVLSFSQACLAMASMDSGLTAGAMKGSSDDGSGGGTPRATGGTH